MKLRSTTPASRLSLAMRMSIVASVVVMAFAVPVQFFAAQPVSADQFDAQIEALRSRIAGYEDEAGALRKKADTLQNTLNVLSNDKQKLQAEINLKQAEHDKLVREIKATEERIKENRRVSGELIVQSSLSGDVPLIVRLASSDNLADYIDGEVSRISVRDTIVEKTEENEKLRDELKEKRAEVKKVLDEQKQRRDELASKERQQSDLIAQTRGSESAYRDRIKKSNSQIKNLEKQREIARLANQNTGGSGSFLSAGGGGGYRWAGAPYPCWSFSCADTWGLYMRECVSYAAWRLDNQGYGVRHFGGQGHAAQWPSTTSSYTQRVAAQKGAVMVRPTTTPHIPPNSPGYDVGHVAYVEERYSDGSIRVSEYNFLVNGTYTERKLSPSDYSGMIFLKFPRK